MREDHECRGKRSWHRCSRNLNPKLKGELVQQGGVKAVEEWVRMSARWMAETHRNLSANGSPMQQAAARETMIAQMREEILHAYEPTKEEEEESISEEEARVFQNFYGGIA